MSVSAIHTFTKTFYFLTETPKALGIKNYKEIDTLITKISKIHI